MRFPARLLGLFFALLLIFFTAKVSFAQALTPTSTPTQQYLAPTTDDSVPQNLHTWTQNVMIEVMSSMLCQLTGTDPIDPSQKCLGIDIKNNKVGYVGNNQGGVLGFLTQGIGMMYVPPVHAGDYISYLNQNFGVAKPSYAQGTGFTSLNPLVPIWSIFRNLTYLFAVIVFVIIGLAIMLRVRIDPRTVMSIQNQIPKIIIALILITFSFAIIGFLIDLMYISMYLIFSLFSGLASPNFSPAQIGGKTIVDAANGLGAFGIVNNVAVAGKDTINLLFGVNPSHTGLLGGGISIIDALGSLFNFQGTDWLHFSVIEQIYNIVSFTGALTIANNIPCASESVAFIGGLGCVAQTALEATPLYLGLHFFLTDIFPFLIIWLIVMIAVIITLFRTLLMLLKAYISIILDLIFAPLWIMGGLLPGTNSVGFSPWIRDVVANLSVFPTVYIMILLANVIGAALSGDQVRNGAFSPPFLGNSIAPGFLGAITSLGLLLMMPEAAKMVKAAFKAPKLELGGLGSIGAASGILTSPVRRIGGSLFGKNPYTNAPKTGSVMLGNLTGRIGLPRVGRFFSGGGVRNDAEIRAGLSEYDTLRGIYRRRRHGPVQGPVPRGTEEEFFRTHGRGEGRFEPEPQDPPAPNATDAERAARARNVTPPSQNPEEDNTENTT